MNFTIQGPDFDQAAICVPVIRSLRNVSVSRQPSSTMPPRSMAYRPSWPARRGT